MPSEIEICALGFLAAVLIIMNRWFSQQKVARKLCLTVDGDVNEYCLRARDFLKSYANFIDDDKNLWNYQSLLDSGVQNKKIIVFCKIGARIEKIQETAILQLDNHFQDKILIFYIKSPHRLEYQMLECKARQINLDINTDEKVMTDALSAFLKIGFFERFNKCMFLMVLLISTIIVLLTPTLCERYDWLNNGKNLFKSDETEPISKQEISTEMLIANISRRYEINYNKITVNWTEEIVKNLRTEKKKLKEEKLVYQRKIQEKSEQYDALQNETIIIRGDYILKHNEIADLLTKIQQKERQLQNSTRELKEFYLYGCVLPNGTLYQIHKNGSLT